MDDTSQSAILVTIPKTSVVVGPTVDLANVVADQEPLFANLFDNVMDVVAFPPDEYHIINFYVIRVTQWIQPEHRN